MLMIRTDEVLDMINAVGGQFFTVEFTKKNGENRVMTGRRGVTKGVTGEGLKFAPADYGMFTMFDIQADGFRMVTIDRITRLTISGKTYQVV